MKTHRSSPKNFISSTAPAVRQINSQSVADRFFLFGMEFPHQSSKKQQCARPNSEKWPSLCGVFFSSLWKNSKQLRIITRPMVNYSRPEKARRMNMISPLILLLIVFIISPPDVYKRSIVTLSYSDCIFCSLPFGFLFINICDRTIYIMSVFYAHII